MVQPTYPCMTTAIIIVLTIQTFVGKMMSLLFHTLSRFVITFFSKKQGSYDAVASVTICSDSGARENKICHCFHCCPMYLQWSEWTRCYDLHFWMLNYKAVFLTLPSDFHQVTLISLHFLPLEWHLMNIWGWWYFSGQSWFQLVSHPAWHSAWCTLHKVK